MSHKVVVLEPGYAHYNVEKDVLKDMDVHFITVPESATDDERAEAVKDAEVILLRDRPLPASLIDHMHQIKGIVRYGVGFNNVDYKHAANKKIPVMNIPDYGTDAVAEFAIGLMLSVSRRIVRRDKAVRGGAWNISEKEPMYLLKGKTLGLVSFGRIAKCFLEKASGLGFAKVLIHDPYISEEVCRQYSVTNVDMDTLCRESEVISMHAPLNDETRDIIDARRLDMMKPTAIIINTGRGGLVNENALYHALANEKIFGAAIDVYETEPVRHGHPFFALNNCVVTDHTAWFTLESSYQMQYKAGLQVKQVLSGGPLNNWVNPW